MHLLGALLIVIVILLLASAGCRKAPSTAPPPPAAVAQAATVEESAPGSRDALRERLIELSDKAPPDKLAFGAMCYKPAGPPARAEHVCPTCGERTLYAVAEPEGGVDWTQASRTLLHTVTGDLPACRRQIKEIDGLTVELDESELCRHCRPAVTTPRLGLVVSYVGEQEPHRVWDVTSDDLKLIAELLAGEVKHTGAQDGETPLKNYTERLEQLLGVEIGPIETDDNG